MIDRVALVGRRHGGHLRELTGTPHQPADHAVAFLYRPRHPTTGVWAATRLFTRDEVDDATRGLGDLPTVLRTLHRRGTEFLRAGHFDPLLHMTNRHHPHLRPGTADYLGVATSSIDPATRRWCALATLVDGTDLVLRIPDIADFYGLRGIDVTSTTRLTSLSTGVIAERPWRWQPADRPLTGGLAEARATLNLLHDLITAPERHQNAPARRRRARTSC